MNRMWMVAAVPLVLLAVIFFGFWTRPSWNEKVMPLVCMATLAGALLTGLFVLFVVFSGWRRGAYAFKRADILLATTLASLDVLIPTAIGVFFILLIRSLKKHPISFM